MSLRRAAVALLGIVVLATPIACDSGGGGQEERRPTPSTTSARFTQRRFYDAFAIRLFTNFGAALPQGYEFSGDSSQVVDLASKDLEYANDAERDRFEFAKSQGLLGFYRGDFTKPGDDDFWGLTTLVFKKPEGAVAMWQRFGNYESVSITGSRLARSQESAVGSGRTGRLFVDVYANEDGSRTFALRGSLLDQNAVHHVISTLDVGEGASFDAFDALRATLGAVEGTMRESYRQARKDGLIDRKGRVRG